jgi:hypothetical protein
MLTVMNPQAQQKHSDSFVQPTPAEGSVLCTAKLQKIQGRMAVLKASVDDLTSGDRYAEATCRHIALESALGAAKL